MFQGLSDRGRTRLAKALLPRITTAVDGAWKALERRPYQSGPFRKPFRCPGSATDLARTRGTWLLRTALTLGDYDRDITWVATWAAEISSWDAATEIGWLLAGALDQEGPEAEEVLEILKASATGEHPTARMGRHVTQALMSSSRKEAWEFNEKLLLAAQRQEGLRQVILEAVDESHPTAFVRMLRLILEERLARFPSIVRAFDTWFGFMWDGSSGLKVEQVLEKALRYLEDGEARKAALAGSEPEDVYLALWTLAFVDVETAIGPATRLLQHRDVGVRFVATHLLSQLGWGPAIAALAPMLEDDDLRVAARALLCFQEDRSKWVQARGLFDRLEGLMKRVAKRSQKLEAIVWPWWDLKIERPSVARAMCAHGKDLPCSRLLPYLQDLDSSGRERFVRKLAGLPDRWAPEKRPPQPLAGAAHEAALELLGDPSPDVRETSFLALSATPIRDEEVGRLVALLDRKAGDRRNRSIARLRTLANEPFFGACERLLADGNEMRRLAGLELLRDAVEHDRCAERARRLAAEHGSASATAEEEERTHMEAILEKGPPPARLDDALGLVDPARLPVWPAPHSRTVDLDSPAAGRCVDSLAQLILEHKDVEVESVSGERILLIDAAWTVGSPRSPAHAIEAEQKLPLLESWRSWVASRGPLLRDGDGLELVRAWTAPDGGSAWSGRHAKELAGGRAWSPGAHLLNNLLAWCIHWEPPNGAFELLLDCFEDQLAGLNANDFRDIAANDERTSIVWGEKRHPFEAKLEAAGTSLRRMRELRASLPGKFDAGVAVRLYALLRWFHNLSGGLRSGWHRDLRIQAREFADVHRHGAFGPSGVDEFLDLLVGRGSARPGENVLDAVSGSKPASEIADFPELLAAVDRCRARIVEVETQRGDRKTAASTAALRLRWSGGLETLGPALRALGSSKFARAHGWGERELSRKDTLSHLVLRSVPRECDTLEAFAEWAQREKVRETRLVELAAYAPQWSRHVAHALGWPGLDGAAWWVHADTEDKRGDQRELKELWAAKVSERTPLSAQDLVEGAVDVAWFHAVYSELGAERWKRLYSAAKYASISGGHTRAQLFAAAMTGEVTQDELVQRIDAKRHQDAVRALGLVHLGAGAERPPPLLQRYERLQEFKRQSREFGSLRQQSEARATTIGLENLARTSGYSDPMRLQWAMEMEAVQDLAHGPITLARGEVTVSLSIEEDGTPQLTAHKSGRKLESVPASLRKDAEVAELRKRATELRRQGSRVKVSLEDATCCGSRFEGEELCPPLRHPVLAPALQRLVFLGEDIAGYPVEGGAALADANGKLEPVRAKERLRIAHPHDLLGRDWSAWQRECLRRERVQPFKQVFRELYPVTKTELEARSRSGRYAGHQVNPGQALALLGGRGWVVQPEEGVSKTYHQEGLTVRLAFEEAFFTPAEIEGLTLDSVCFTRKGEHEPLDLSGIAPRLFSETMRDLDLVVSVAHRGGVDPEATASTIEMRAALLRETCTLLGFDNVEVKEHNAIVRGKLGQYSVHLGSASARILGGASLPIVAVASQHRGRLFLPFADDDPRTAEVLSKVLLLGRDGEIRDPTILEWIRMAQR